MYQHLRRNNVNCNIWYYMSDMSILLNLTAMTYILVNFDNQINVGIITNYR